MVSGVEKNAQNRLTFWSKSGIIYKIGGNQEKYWYIMLKMFDNFRSEGFFANLNFLEVSYERRFELCWCKWSNCK